jgi:hypothetical protein
VCVCVRACVRACERDIHMQAFTQANFNAVCKYIHIIVVLNVHIPQAQAQPINTSQTRQHGHWQLQTHAVTDTGLRWPSSMRGHT